MYWTSLYFYDRADFYLKSYLHFHSKSSYITWACSGKKFLKLICLEQHNTNLSFLIVVYYQGQCHQKIYGLWDLLWNISHKNLFEDLTVAYSLSQISTLVIKIYIVSLILKLFYHRTTRFLNKNVEKFSFNLLLRISQVNFSYRGYKHSWW